MAWMDLYRSDLSVLPVDRGGGDYAFSTPAARSRRLERQTDPARGPAFRDSLRAGSFPCRISVLRPVHDPHSRSSTADRHLHLHRVSHFPVYERKRPNRLDSFA